MNPRLYRLYRFVTAVKRRVHRKVTPAGRLLLTFTALAILFGFNTRMTMIYQLAALAVVLLLVAFPISFFFTPRLRVQRLLPDTCTAGETLTYLLQLENIGRKLSSGLFFLEHPVEEYPTFDEFNTLKEEGESNRNFFDRKLGYYRWLWLLERMAGARYQSLLLPPLSAGESMQTEVSLLPLRRGYVQLAGYSLFRMEPLGLFKKEILFRDTGRLLVLPKMYPVVQADLSGSRKYHQGGLTSVTSCGDSGEFISLREYRPGDPVKHIDWKATARVGGAIVRQYQDEYFSRYGVLLDTFAEQEGGNVFEDAVSVAASIIAQQDSTNNLIDLLFAGDRSVTSVSMGRGQAAQHHMLEILACIDCCRNREFSDLAELVMAHLPLLSGLILILIDLDESRIRLIRYLESMKVPHTVILVSADLEGSKKLLMHMELQDVKLFDAVSDIKLVDLR